MFEIYIVPPDADEKTEQIGTKRKCWFRNEHGHLYLFKEGRPNTGENWSEKVCSELCQLMGIPHAEYDLAEWKEYAGVITPSFVPEGQRMIFGNELLARIVKEYEHEKRYKVRQYTIGVVQAIMKSTLIGFPDGFVQRFKGAPGAGVFLGYLMLDALVANQDRHHENWGLILGENRRLTLAPTYDHAASLGRNETDVTRIRLMTTSDRKGDIQSYCYRGRSAFYLSNKAPKPMSTVAAFVDVARGEPEAAEYWLNALRRTTIDDYREIFDKLPATWITSTAAEFSLKMLEINRLRLLSCL